MNNHKDNHTNENSPPLMTEIYSRADISKFVLKALIRTETDSIYIKDPLGRLNMVIKKFLNEMEKNGQQEIIGKTDEELFGFEFGSNTQKEEQHLFETGEPIASAIEVRRASPDNHLWTHTTKIPLMNS